MQLSVILVALGLGVSAQAQSNTGGVQSVTASTPTYIFGSTMSFNESLNMAQYGPLRSTIKKCETTQAFCLASDFAVIGVPKSCKYFKYTNTINAYGHIISKIGDVQYYDIPREKVFDVVILSVDNREDILLGYEPHQGVLFVVSDATKKPKLLQEMKGKAGSALQRSFEERRNSVLALTGNNRMFACLNR